MIRVFSAQIPAHAHIVRGALEAAGVDAEVRGEARTALAGGLPVEECFAEVWIPTNKAEEAQAVIERLVPTHAVGGLALVPDGLMGGEVSLASEWTCKGCREPNPATFEICWSCGEDRA